MRYIAAALGFLLVLTTEAKIGNSSESELCSETKECLLYTPVCQGDGYEVRHYDGAMWVTTTEERSFVMESATYTAFMRLFKYISGANQDGTKIEMTAPVIIKSEPRTSLFQRRTYTMSFLLPSTHQASPPLPTDKKVSVVSLPDMNVYVRGYGGWMTTLGDMMSLRSLRRSLDSVQARYNEDYYYAVGYDSPMKMFNRHNEAWLVVEGEPVCPPALLA